MLLKDNDVVLFQGDSITDTKRSREDPDSMGNGYAMMTASLFSAFHPDKNVKFINRGISGNRAKDLKARWDEDCMKLNPTIVSILIGINDCWRRYDRNDPTPVEEFEQNYRSILEKLKGSSVRKIIMCEPFVLPYPEDRRKWREDLDPKINSVRDLAREYNALLLPLDGIFNSAAAYKPPEFWAADGVHPTLAGHALIAKVWLEIIKCL